MKVTDYTLHLINEYKKVRIYIANFYGFTEQQTARLLKAGCKHDQGGYYFDTCGIESFHHIAENLAGFTMGYIVLL